MLTLMPGFGVLCYIAKGKINTDLMKTVQHFSFGFDLAPKPKKLSEL